MKTRLLSLKIKNRKLRFVVTGVGTILMIPVIILVVIAFALTPFIMLIMIPFAWLYEELSDLAKDVHNMLCSEEDKIPTETKPMIGRRR